MDTKKIIVPFLLISSMAFADIKVDFIKKEKNAKDYTYNITLPQFEFNGKEMKDLNGAFTNEILMAVRKVKAEGEELKKSGSTAKAENIINFKKYDNNFGITSVVTNNYSYSGGANGMTVLNSYNIDNSNGKILTFDDIFIRSAKQSFEKGILQIVKNNKSGKYLNNVENINLDDAVMYFDGDYIVFKFQQYIISPRSSGNPTFRYHKDAVKSFIKYNFNC